MVQDGHGAAEPKGAGAPRKPRLAVFKLSSCDGCQLQLLDAEEALLALVGARRHRPLPRGHEPVRPGPVRRRAGRGLGLDPVADSRGSARSARESTYLITIGACANSGGIQALRNVADADAFVRTVYADARVHQHAGHVHAGLGSRPRRPRDPRLPDRPRPAAGRAASSLLRGAVPRLSDSPRLRRMQAARVRLRARRARANRAWVRSRARAAAHSAPAWAASATGASGRRSRRTPAALTRRFMELGLTPKDVAARFRVHHGLGAGVPCGGRRAEPTRRGDEVPPMTHRCRRRRTASSRSRRSRASRARARCTCAVDGGEIVRPAAGDLRAAAVLRSVPGGPPLLRGPGHRPADLRHLPGRVPDERDPRARVGVRRRRCPTASANCAGSCTCARVDREPHAARRTCSRRRTSSGYESAVTMAATEREAARARPDAQAPRQRPDGRDRRPGDPSRLAGGRRLLEGAAPRRPAGVPAPARRRAGRGPARRRLGRAASTSPPSPAGRAGRPVAPGRVPDQRGRGAQHGGSRVRRRRRSRTPSRSCTSNTRTRCTRSSPTRGRRTSSGRSRA